METRPNGERDAGTSPEVEEGGSKTDEEVDEQSEESFPASDPPSY